MNKMTTLLQMTGGALVAILLSVPAAAQELTPPGVTTRKDRAADKTLAPWSAQEREFDGAEYTRHFGTQKAGGALRVGAKIGIGSKPKEFEQDLSAPKADEKSSLVEIKGTVAADVLLFGRSIEAVSVEKAFGKKLEIKVAGFTVVLPEKSAGRERSNAVAETGSRERSNAVASREESGAETEDLGRRNLLVRDFRTNFMIGPVPVVVTGNAGVGLEFGVVPEVALHTSLSQARLGLKVEAGAYVEGWVAAGVGFDAGVAAATAGLQATLRLLHTTVGVQLSCCPGNGDKFGKLALKIAPCALKLALFAKAKVLFLEKVWTLTVFSWSAGAIEFGYTFLDTIAASSSETLVQRAASDTVMRRAIIEILARRTIKSVVAGTPDLAAIRFIEALAAAGTATPEAEHELRCARSGRESELNQLTPGQRAQFVQI